MAKRAPRNFDRRLTAPFLARAVASWLEFEYRCGRRTLFCERYLATPIGQFLTSNADHPVIAEAELATIARSVGTKQGRPRAVDFAVLKLRKKDTPDLIIESKMATARGRSKAVRPLRKDVIEDIFRLAAMRLELKPTCWFLIAGQRKLLDRVVPSGGIPVSTSAEKMCVLKFSREIGRSESVALKRGDVPLNDRVREFETECTGKLPDRISVTLVGDWPPMGKPTDLSCLIWEVGLVRGRRGAAK